MVGCPFIRVTDGSNSAVEPPKNPPLATVRTLLEAVQWILTSTAAEREKTSVLG